MKISKKFLSLILSVMLVFSTAGVSAYADEDDGAATTSTTVSTTAATTKKSQKDEKSTTQSEKEKKAAQKKLEAQRKELEAKRRDAEKKLAKFGKDAKATEEYILALDEKIGYLNEELSVLQAQVEASEQKIEELDKQMKPLKDELDKLQKSYDKSKAEYEKLNSEFEKTYNAYCLRLRAMYISGNTSVIATLLSSDDISEFLSRYEMIRAVSKNDSELLKRVKTEMKVIVEKQDGLTERKNELHKKKKVYDDKVKELTVQQDSVQKKRSAIAIDKATLADDRAKSDELYAEYAANNKIYSDFADEDEDALKSLDKEIDDLMSGKKSADEVTTAKAPKLKDKSDVKVEHIGGDVYRNSNASIGFRWPVPGHTRLSQHFGHVRAGRVHKGIDIPCPTGSKIVAAQKGVVIRARSNASEAYGYHVMIYHGTDAKGRRIVTCYAHNSKLLVSVGQSVSKGQQIAKSGSTGRSTGPHCHFEVIIDGTKVNPENYL